MKAAVVTQTGLEIREVPAPVPGRNQVLVRVRACALNRADLGVAAGHKHGAIGGPGTIVGMEFAGEVVEVGAEASGLKPGERVMCAGAGGFAELAVADWGRAMPIPASMGFEPAATLPVALTTMHNALVTAGRLAAGESVLIQGASSGVGLMALQIARHLGAAPVIGSSTNAVRREKLKAFGADLAIDTSDPAWPDAVLAATGGKGVHLIIDQVSASVANANMQAARVLGRIVNVGRLGGTKGEFDYDLHALKRIDYIGVTFRTRSIEEVREINRRMRADLWGAIEAGTLRLPIDRSFPLAEAAAALAHMRANAHFGKIVLTV
jgi:NADPH2:quinone reductase